MTERVRTRSLRLHDVESVCRPDMCPVRPSCTLPCRTRPTQAATTTVVRALDVSNRLLRQL